MSQLLIELSLPSADTVIYNSHVLFHKHYTINNSCSWRKMVKCGPAV